MKMDLLAPCHLCFYQIMLRLSISNKCASCFLSLTSFQGCLMTSLGGDLSSDCVVESSGVFVLWMTVSPSTYPMLLNSRAWHLLHLRTHTASSLFLLTCAFQHDLSIKGATDHPWNWWQCLLANSLVRLWWHLIMSVSLKKCLFTGCSFTKSVKHIGWFNARSG